MALAMANIGNEGNELLLASRALGGDLRQNDLSVPGVHCGACIRTVETALNAVPGVESARVNLSTRRVSVNWRGQEAPLLIRALSNAGYDATIHDFAATKEDAEFTRLVRAMAIAGFASGNIMLLSVSVWSGADAVTRDTFYWFSAAIALPVLFYSGQVFFASAWRALRHGRTNMDVPISIGVLLSYAMSLYETVNRGEHAYFDAATSLLFFLLIGRTLDYYMRERARTAVKGLAKLAARGAVVLGADGTRTYTAVDDIEPGMTLLVAAGERIPVDGTVASGASELDQSLLTGESLPQAVGPGDRLQAGTMNLTGPLTIRVTARAQESFLAEMMRMMEKAEAGRSAYRRIADRAAGLYAPVVHTAALATLIGWLMLTGDVHQSVTVAVAVLIITCPCALGLAVPMVQVVAARRLFEAGILLKDGSALERLAEVDTALFDKTGTLTLGKPRVVDVQTRSPSGPAIAAAMAQWSRHPYSQALAAAFPPGADIEAQALSEHPGQGLEADMDGARYRLGKPAWALSGNGTGAFANAASVVLSRDGAAVASFTFEDRLRADAPAAVGALRRNGIDVRVVSGDRKDVVEQLAGYLKLPFFAEVSPAGKVDAVSALQSEGRKVLMVGDGLNDAPALAAAHASMAPGSAADIGRNAADLVFLHESLRAVPVAFTIAADAARLVRQNLWLSVLYNVIAVPIAVAGLVTPLVAAVAMSLSSVVVVANALRLSGDGERRRLTGWLHPRRIIGAA